MVTNPNSSCPGVEAACLCLLYGVPLSLIQVPRAVCCGHVQLNGLILNKKRSVKHKVNKYQYESKFRIDLNLGLGGN